ncbi:ribonuclease H-like domain-containing protein [Tanacetum coccineum]
MINYDPSRTPVDTESKMGDDGDPVSDMTLYRSLAGALQYLTFTLLDISYVVQQVCLYMHDPREPYFSALKWILCYVHGTLDHGLQLYSSSITSLVAYSDAELTLSRSSAEAEYHGVVNAVAETCWLRNLLRSSLALLYSSLYGVHPMGVLYAVRKAQRASSSLSDQEARFSPTVLSRILFKPRFDTSTCPLVYG